MVANNTIATRLSYHSTAWYVMMSLADLLAFIKANQFVVTIVLLHDLLKVPGKTSIYPCNLIRCKEATNIQHFVGKSKYS